MKKYTHKYRNPTFKGEPHRRSTLTGFKNRKMRKREKMYGKFVYDSLPF